MTIQIIILLLLAFALGLWLRAFPYPSPVIRPILPARRRWPEPQIRGWLSTGRFHPGYLGFFYRDPARHAPADPGILAPADGLVTSFDVQGGIRYLVIALSFWDMHTQRSPFAGQVTDVSPSGDCRIDGEGRDFAFLRAKQCPVQSRIALATDAGEMAIRLITSVAARRIETWVTPGDQIERGQRLGRILLGSTVVLELPEAWTISVAVGERVWAGRSIVSPCPSEKT